MGWCVDDVHLQLLVDTPLHVLHVSAPYILVATGLSHQDVARNVQQTQVSCRLLYREAVCNTAVNLFRLTPEAIANYITKMEIRLHHRLVQQATKEGIPCPNGRLTADALPAFLPCHPDVEIRVIEADSPSGRDRPGTVGQKGLFATQHIKPYTILGSYQGIVKPKRLLVCVYVCRRVLVEWHSVPIVCIILDNYA